MDSRVKHENDRKEGGAGMTGERVGASLNCLICTDEYSLILLKRRWKWNMIRQLVKFCTDGRG